MSDPRSPGAPGEPEEPHVAEDLAEGQGVSDEPLALPAEDVAQLAGIRPAGQRSGVTWGDEVDRLGSMTDVRIDEGDLEARPPASDQPDEPEQENLELLVEDELRAEETDDPNEAAEDGMTWVAPMDPPVVPGRRGQPEVAAGFGTTAEDEPFDADHHRELLTTEDEVTERVVEALRSHAATSPLAERLSIETEGARVIVDGVVDDIVDEDEIVGVISGVDGVSDVVSRVSIRDLG